MSSSSTIKKLLLAALIPLFGLGVSEAMAAAKPKPIQFSLGGEWLAGSDQQLTPLGMVPQSFAIPAGATMVIRYVSCNVLVDIGTTAFIAFTIAGGIVPEFNIIPIRGSEFSSTQTRLAATVSTEIYLGITPSIGPAVGNKITIDGQRETSVLNGAVVCTLSGDLTL